MEQSKFFSLSLVTLVVALNISLLCQLKRVCRRLHFLFFNPWNSNNEDRLIKLAAFSTEDLETKKGMIFNVAIRSFGARSWLCCTIENAMLSSIRFSSLITDRSYLTIPRELLLKFTRPVEAIPEKAFFLSMAFAIKFAWPKDLVDWAENDDW